MMKETKEALITEANTPGVYNQLGKSKIIHVNMWGEWPSGHPRLSSVILVGVRSDA